MSVNTPPNPNVSTFNPLYWIVDGVNLTGYLKFPTGQGTETLPGLIVSGTTSLLGATTSSALITTTDLKVNNTLIHLGTNAGLSQGANSIAIGNLAGQLTQQVSSVAIGNSAGNDNQGSNSVAIGNNSASVNQGENSIAIGLNTNVTGNSTIAIGNGSNTNSSTNSVAIGLSTGIGAGTTNNVAIGFAATTSTFSTSVALGASATCSASNQIMLGTTSQIVSIPRIINFSTSNIISRSQTSSQNLTTSTTTNINFNTSNIAGTYTGITFASGVFTNTNTYPINVNISVSVGWASNAVGRRIASIVVGTAYLARQIMDANTFAGETATSLSLNYSIPASGTFSVTAYQNSGADLTLTNGGTSNITNSPTICSVMVF